MAFYLQKVGGGRYTEEGESLPNGGYGYSSQNEAYLAMGRFGSGGVKFDLGTVEIVEE